MFNGLELASLALMGGADVAAFAAGISGYKTQQELLQQEEQQTQMATTQRSIMRETQLQRTLSTAIAREGASGISLASPSFKAVIRSSFNAFDKDENIDALNLSFKRTQIREQEQLSREREFGDILGTISSVGTNLLSAL